MASMPHLRMDPPPRSPRRRCAWLHHGLGPEWTTEYKVVGAGFRRATDRGSPLIVPATRKRRDDTKTFLILTVSLQLRDATGQAMAF